MKKFNENDFYILCSFSHIALRGVQSGIQTTHSVAEMFNKYHHGEIDGDSALMLNKWSRQDKVIHCYVGGSAKNLTNIIDTVSETNLPFGYFVESEEFMNGALTNVSFVFPYNTVKEMNGQSASRIENYYLSRGRPIPASAELKILIKKAKFFN